MLYDSKHKRKSCQFLIYYRTITSIILLVILTIFLSLSFSLPYVPDSNIRNNIIFDESLPILFFVYVWITSFAWICLWVFIEEDIFDYNGTSSRNISDLISNIRYAEINDLITYNKKSVVNYIKKKGLTEEALKCFGM